MSIAVTHPPRDRESGVGNLQHIDIDALTANYISGASLRELAAAADCSPGTVRARLLAAGVELRPKGGRVRYPLLEDVEWLRRRYMAERASSGTIARELGCTQEAALDALRRHAIPVRDRSDALAARHAAAELATPRAWIAQRVRE